jgi:hypothetical protein
MYGEFSFSYCSLSISRGYLLVLSAFHLLSQFPPFSNPIYRRCPLFLRVQPEPIDGVMDEMTGEEADEATGTGG